MNKKDIEVIKVWTREFNSHLDIFKAIAHKDFLYESAIKLWLGLNTDDKWTYVIFLTEDKVYLRIVIFKEKDNQNRLC